MNDDLQRRLDEWGTSATPPVDGAFANRLEADLRMSATEGGAATRPWWTMLLRPSFVAVALLVVGGIAGTLLLDSEADGVVMVASEGGTVSVSVPGSPTTVVGAAGLDLPDGTEVRVGPGGTAIIDGVVLTPGSIARIDDGALELIEIDARDLVDPATTSTTAVDTAPTTVDPPATTSPPTTVSPTSRPGPTVVDSDTTDRPGTSDTPTTVGPDEPSTTVPDTTVAPDPDRTTTTTEAPNTTTTVASDQPIPVRLAVSEPIRRQVNLVWGTEPTDRVAGWIVLERRGDTVRRVAIVRNANANRLRVEVPGPLVEWRIRAIDADGEPVGQSRWVGLPG